MTEIVLFANDEVLELVKAPTISSGDVNCVSLAVDFSKEWDGFTKVAVLFNGDFSPESNYEKVLTNGECTVPGEVLKGAEPFYIGIKGIKTDATKTTTILKYQVIKGVPTVITEITEDVYQQILAAYANLETIRNEVDADAKQTAADRAEVKKMVDSVAGIDEQVAKVEQLSQQAQESATQAGTSATASEKAKAQAETAKAGAETAAGKTAEDRKAVDQAKTAVEEAQQAVKADRTAVEEVKQSVEQFGNAIPEATQAGVQAVNQAKQTAVDEITQTGTAHKTAVEGAGTKAVQAVEKVRQTATQAVETAKTGAVQAVQTEGTKQTENVTVEGARQVKTITDTGTQQTQAVTAEGQKQLTAVQQAAQEIVADREQIQTNKTDIAYLRQNKAGAIINTVKGKIIILDDSSELLFESFDIFGESKQDGIPTPETPKEIISTEIREIKVTGSNLIPHNDIEITQNNIYCGKRTGIYLKKGIKYVFSVDGGKTNLYFNKYLQENAIYKGYGVTYLEYTPSESGLYYLNLYDEKDVSKYKNLRLNISKDCGYEPYTERTITLAEPIVLNGLKVNHGGNYTDSSGQQWLCDYIDFKHGKYVQNIRKVALSEHDYNIQSVNEYGIVNFSSFLKETFDGENSILCTNLKEKKTSIKYETEEGIYIVNRTMYIRIKQDRFNTVEKLKEWLKANNVVACYTLETQNEIDLPSEVITAYKALHTNYPNTVITNNANADMQLSYVADTKMYIDKKLKQLVVANQANTANLLSLMPMETQAAMIKNDTNNILESEVTQ